MEPGGANNRGTPARRERRFASGCGRSAVIDESFLAEGGGVEDDREVIANETDKKVVLIIENDLPFMRILMDRGKRKGVQDAGRGSRRCRLLAMAKHYRAGWPLRSTSTCQEWMGGRCWIGSNTTPLTRHIPVHIISMSDEGTPRDAARRELAYLSKPVERGRALQTKRSASIRGFRGSSRSATCLSVEENDDV